MLTISASATVTSAFSIKPSVAAQTSSTSSNPADQSADSSAAASATAASTSTSATPSAADVAAAKAAAANSASYSFATVAQNALTVINAGIQQLGHQPDDHTTGAQWDQIFGTMDRRSLYAVASNEGGQFSNQEQQAAASVMSYQLGQTLGNIATAGSDAERMADFANSINFLENVSPEEKTSPLWAVDMSAAMTSYNMIAADAGAPPQTYNGTNPLVKMLMVAMKAAQYDPSKDRTVGEENDLAGILSQPWAQGFQSQIQQAYAASISQGSSVNIQA